MSTGETPKIVLGSDWKNSPAESPKPAAPPQAAAEGSKLVVDSDWKSQAQAEKDRLAEQAEQKAAATGAGARGLPPADFQSLVGTLVTQALLYMGGFPDPETGRAVVSLEHARFHIDLLGVLEQKAKGNITPEEASDLQQALHELRLRFVEISQAVAEMAKNRPRTGAGPTGVPLPH